MKEGTDIMLFINKGIPEWWNGLNQDYFNEYLAEPDEIDELVKKHIAERGMIMKENKHEESIRELTNKLGGEIIKMNSDVAKVSLLNPLDIKEEGELKNE